MSPSFIRNLALLLARIGLGVVFMAHGWQKFHDNGLAGTAGGFAKMGVPVPTASAYFATFAELVGGAALILGAFTAVAGLLLFLDMLGAFAIVHISNGVFVGEGGYELVVALGAGALLLAVFGAGKLSFDGVAGRKLGRAAGLAKV